jgi:hypothetical protein
VKIIRLAAAADIRWATARDWIVQASSKKRRQPV